MFHIFKNMNIVYEIFIQKIISPWDTIQKNSKLFAIGTNIIKLAYWYVLQKKTHKRNVPWAAYKTVYPINAPACLWGGIGCQLTLRAVDVTPPHSTEDGPSSGAEKKG